MRILRNFLDTQKERFESGGKLDRLYPLFEAVDTLLYTPDKVTAGTTHVRDALDLLPVVQPRDELDQSCFGARIDNLRQVETNCPPKVGGQRGGTGKIRQSPEIGSPPPENVSVNGSRTGAAQPEAVPQPVGQLLESAS